MDEMINRDLVRQLRSERCWSQEHLALVSGISLRTVQRVEKDGKCSLDSMKAIAAAFDTNASVFTSKETTVLPLDDHRRVAALSWLDSVDSGEYANCWCETARIIQTRISCSDWVEKLEQVLDPLGNVVTRSIKNTSEYESLPGVPDGKYTVVVFDTIYERKKSAEETVTLIKTGTGWRVVGYFIN